MLNDVDSTPTLVGCTFDGNSAGSSGSGSGDGGGMHNDDSSPTLTDCAFIENVAVGLGGGSYYRNSDPSTLTDCTFRGNAAGWHGGGMYSDSDLRLMNCTLSGNVTGSDGGGIYAFNRSTLTNCAFSENVAAGQGGGIYAHSPATTTNCILWGNSDSSGTGELAQFYGPGPIAYSCIQGCTTYCADPNEHNIGDDPLFVRNPDPGPDGTWNGVDDDYGNLHLSSGSPCIDAGDNTAVPAGVIADLDGKPRFLDDPDTPDTGNGTPPIVDMGAYERPAFPSPVPVLTVQALAAAMLLIAALGAACIRRRAVTPA